MRFSLRLDNTKVQVHANVTNRDLPPLERHLQQVLGAEVSPNGKLIVTAGGDDNTRRIWDAYFTRFLLFCADTQAQSGVPPSARTANLWSLQVMTEPYACGM